MFWTLIKVEEDNRDEKTHETPKIEMAGWSVSNVPSVNDVSLYL